MMRYKHYVEIKRRWFIYHFGVLLLAIYTILFIGIQSLMPDVYGLIAYLFGHTDLDPLRNLKGGRPLDPIDFVNKLKDILWQLY